MKRKRIRSLRSIVFFKYLFMYATLKYSISGFWPATGCMQLKDFGRQDICLRNTWRAEHPADAWWCPPDLMDPADPCTPRLYAINSLCFRLSPYCQHRTPDPTNWPCTITSPRQRTVLMPLAAAWCFAWHMGLSERSSERALSAQDLARTKDTQPHWPYPLAQGQFRSLLPWCTWIWLQTPCTCL